MVNFVKWSLGDEDKSPRGGESFDGEKSNIADSQIWGEVVQSSGDDFSDGDLEIFPHGNLADASGGRAPTNFVVALLGTLAAIAVGAWYLWSTNPLVTIGSNSPALSLVDSDENPNYLSIWAQGSSFSGGADHSVLRSDNTNQRLQDPITLPLDVTPITIGNLPHEGSVGLLTISDRQDVLVERPDQLPMVSEGVKRSESLPSAVLILEPNKPKSSSASAVIQVKPVEPARAVSFLGSGTAPLQTDYLHVQDMRRNNDPDANIQATILNTPLLIGNNGKMVSSKFLPVQAAIAEDTRQTVVLPLVLRSATKDSAWVEYAAAPGMLVQVSVGDRLA